MKLIKIFIMMLLMVFVFSFLYGCGTKETSETPQTTAVVCPWKEEGAKQPSDYTWEEFEALSEEAQKEFQKSFVSTDEFDEWLEKSQTTVIIRPWEEEGAKQPSDYTWEEFEALSGEDQIAFQKSFVSIDEFDKWLTANQP